MMVLPRTFSIENAIVNNTSGDNLSIYEKRLTANITNFQKVPHRIYFYYLTFGDEGLPIVRRYLDDNNGNPVEIPYDSVESHITQLARNARNGGTNPPPLPGYGITGSIWEHKSYISLVVDSMYWRLHKYGPNNRTAIAINSLRGGANNYTFFDAADMNVDMTGTGEFRTAVYFINHMKKNEEGDDLTYKSDGITRDSQTFKFDIYYDVERADGTVEEIRDDPGGTNLGPPAPPP